MNTETQIVTREIDIPSIVKGLQGAAMALYVKLRAEGATPTEARNLVVETIDFIKDRFNKLEEDQQ